ncbi:Root cap [Heracleum sosnowskyi]|uniref:Root cap n=1 Tax=Heracleum sosnowskyi TaxID=360622 RepID=A0AAD8M5V9_9APIA|nr:Root cap [Heracleum sosnowskyi]
MRTSTCNTSFFLLLALLVSAIFQGDSAEFSPQSRVCTDYSRKCGGKQIYCPKQCPTFKASTEKGKGCFIDCNSRDCEAICKTRKPNCNGIGSACYDPRFVGGDGVMFYFHGKTNEHFSLVSDTNFHINARFIGRRPQGRSRDNTWIQGLSLMFGSHTFTLSANKVAKWDSGIDQFLFTYDELPIHISSGYINTWTAPDSNLTVERTTLYNSISLTLPGVVEMSVNVVPVTKEDDRLHNYQIPADDCFAHLEVQFKFFSLTDKVEGVLGQTYRPEFKSPVKRGVPMPVMGGEDRFMTSSLVAADCKKCIFVGNESNSAAKSMLLDGDMTVDCSSRSTSHSHGFACRR